MILSTVILGIGHIGIHLGHAKEVTEEKKKRHILIRILKGILCVVSILIFGVIAVVIGCRNINFVSHYANYKNGVDEGVYVNSGDCF